MKKPSFIIHNQQGFILPYTLFVIAIMLFILTIQVTTYQNDIRISHNHQEQFKIKTLIQMGQEQFKQDIVSKQKTTGSVAYQFPPGKVSINYKQLDPSTYKLDWVVSPPDKTYRQQNILTLDESNLNDE